MARINDQFLDSVVYVYPTESAARSGEQVGGTGFVIQHLIEGRTDLAVHYIVTNSHVAVGGVRFVRFNTKSGGIFLVEVLTEQWTHGGVDDVAVIPFALSEELSERLKFAPIVWPTMSLLQEDIPRFYLGVGDEVVMIGRLAHLRGAPSLNRAVARSGMIAMMPGEPIIDARNFAVEAFLVEMRSLSGYSGSPVICTIVPGAWRGLGISQNHGEGHQFVLGIDCGHIKMASPVVDESGTRVTEKYQVYEHSGISIVVPAWRIIQLLQDPYLVEQRASAARAN